MSAQLKFVEPAASLRDLFDAAKRACDHWKDDQAARDAMKADCLATPAHLRAELIQHFEESYK